MGRSFEEDGVQFVYPGYVIEVMTSRFDIVRYFFIFFFWRYNKKFFMSPIHYNEIRVIKEYSTMTSSIV